MFDAISQLSALNRTLVAIIIALFVSSCEPAPLTNGKPVTETRYFDENFTAIHVYNDIDVVVPVPLHPFKLLKRGYNQSTYLAEGIAESLGAKVDTRAARRIRNNPSQARRGARDRWENVDELFRIVRPERLHGKHILVVDDVLTSGATLTTLLKEIVHSVPNCRISIATLAVTKHITPLGK